MFDNPDFISFITNALQIASGYIIGRSICHFIGMDKNASR